MTDKSSDMLDRIKAAWTAHGNCEWTHPKTKDLPPDFPGWECACGQKPLELGKGRAYYDVVLNTHPSPLILPAEGTHSRHLVEALTRAVFDDPVEGDYLNVFSAWDYHNKWFNLWHGPQCNCAFTCRTLDDWLDHMAAKVAAVAEQPALL